MTDSTATTGQNSPAPQKADLLSSWDRVFPNDANPSGTMFGGQLMAIMDKVGALVASIYAECRVTTASAEAMDFKGPIFVGDRIETRGRVVRVGTSSMIVRLDVYADTPGNPERRHCITAHFTFVALDTDAKPTPVPPLLIETASERRDHEVAEIIRRKAILRKERIAATEPGQPGAAEPA